MKKKIQVVAGLALGLFLLWLVFRKTDWAEVWQSILAIHKGWFALILLFVGASFVTRVQRWSYIVRTAKPVSFRHMFSATQIGFLANFALPMRLGELIRALVLTRLAALPISKSIAMVALDRVTDLIGLMFVIIVAILAYTPTETIVIPADVIGVEMSLAPSAIWWSEMSMLGLLAATLTSLIILYVKKDLLLRINAVAVGKISEHLAARTGHFIREFAEGLHIFRSVKDMAKSIFFSLLTWATFVGLIEACLRAFGVHAPWYTAFVIQVLLAVAVSVPSTPGFTGPFHLAIVAGLIMLAPDTSLDKAKAMAIVAHLVNVASVVGAGVVCLWVENMKLVELSRDAGRTDEALLDQESAEGAE